jgi:hypothetical protein
MFRPLVLSKNFEVVQTFKRSVDIGLREGLNTMLSRPRTPLFGIRDASLNWMFASDSFRCLANPYPWVVVALLPLGLALETGCASQGPLQPPSLHLPAPAEKLTAERVGDQVLLSWTTPAKTTDGDLVKGPVSANICFDASPSATPLPAAAPKKGRRARKPPPVTGAPVAVCHAVANLAVTAGPSHASASLPPDLTSGSASLVAYSIELDNARGRSAGPSAPVYVAAGSAPPAVSALNISPRRENALIQWKPEPGTATMELKRTLIATVDGPVSAAPPAQAKAPSPFSPSSPKTPPRELTLRPDIKTAKDPGGISDPGVRDGDTYTYVAQRVETVTLEGHTVELRSVASAPATFAFHDIFPPKPPTGLVLVPGGGFGETPSIDLAWDANFEPDLLGYNVYRGDGDSAFVKINPEPLPTPSYRDLRVEPGRQYTYRVTAVDQRHNESPPSAIASESLRK